MKGYCCECKKDVEVEIVSGEVIYPHRPDLYQKKFYRCPVCGNYTGVYDGEYPTLPNEYIRRKRHDAHRRLDAIWRNRKLKARYYKYMSDAFNREFHWGMIRNIEDADKAYYKTINFLKELK